MDAESLREAQIRCREEEHKVTSYIHHEKKPTNEVRNRMMSVINSCEQVCRDFSLLIDGRSIQKFRSKFKKALEHPARTSNSSAALYAELAKILDSFYAIFSREQLRLAAVAAAAAGGGGGGGRHRRQAFLRT